MLWALMCKFLKKSCQNSCTYHRFPYFCTAPATAITRWQMKLISEDNLSTAPAPVEVAEAIVLENALLSVKTDPVGPAATTAPTGEVLPTAKDSLTVDHRLTWADYRDLFKNMSINAGIRQWMTYSVQFRNWVACCITAFESMPNIQTWTAKVPDQFKHDIGVNEIFFHRQAPGKVHVMN